MSKVFDDDPLFEDLRKKHPKSGPDPKPGESLDIWAERYIQYVRIKHGTEEEKK